jgi:hypothetical protein
MDREDWLEVVSIKKIINFSRKLVYYNFDEETSNMDDATFLEKIDNIGPDTEPEMDLLLPYDECKSMFKPMLITEKNRMYIKDDDYDDFLVQLNQRMVSNIIHGLVRRGVLHTAFDDEKNDFIFWVKKEYELDDDEESTETD